MTAKDWSKAEAEEILLRAAEEPIALLQANAAALRDIGRRRRLSYSRKVFIPLQADGVPSEMIAKSR
jgi:hypothetical protein